jgi:sensor histidine kinase YesM
MRHPLSANLTLISLTSGGRSVGTVCLRTNATGVCLNSFNLLPLLLFRFLGFYFVIFTSLFLLLPFIPVTALSSPIYMPSATELQALEQVLHYRFEFPGRWQKYTNGQANTLANKRANMQSSIHTYIESRDRVIVTRLDW